MKMSRTINFKPKCKKEQTRSGSSFDQTQGKMLKEKKTRISFFFNYKNLTYYRYGRKQIGK